MDLLRQLFAHTSPWVPVLCLLLCLCLGSFVGLWAARRRIERRTARSRRCGRRGAERALRLLRRRGYRIVAEEVTGTGSVLVDGELQTYTVRCDALVERRGRTFVAELKGGPQAARIENRATRRQLLEYAWVYRAEAVLLVDADRNRIHQVQFPAEHAAALSIPQPGRPSAIPRRR